jgi:hypothetical protein
MSSSRFLFAILALCIPAAPYAATHHRYECPSPLVDGKVKRSLSHIDVFDGPPMDMASLIPAPAGNVAIWDKLEDVDVYLVCEYKGTDKIVTIHAIGATNCTGTDHPSAAFCD